MLGAEGEREENEERVKWWRGGHGCVVVVIELFGC